MKKGLIISLILKINLTLFMLTISLIKKKLLNQNIGIAYGLNNKYIYPTLVSMISILENAHRNTFCTFYLLVEKYLFKQENKDKLMHLEKKYERCKIVIIELTNKNLKTARIDRYPLATYFRLLLADLIKDLNRIIYLDGDTIVLQDLSEMINLKMNNNLILGFVDNSYKKAEAFGIKTYKYITAGVILINLKKMRKENITQKFFDFIEINNKKLTQEDQTVINIMLHGRIDLLPPKFGVWNFFNQKSLFNHNIYRKKNLNIKIYDEDILLKAWKFPSILHFVRSKPWKKKRKYTNKEFHEKWWEYAKLSDEYNNIINFYGGRK